MSFSPPSINIPQPAVPQAPAAPPMFGQPAQAGSKPQAKPSQPTYLGANLSAAPQNLGQKTLLGT